LKGESEGERPVYPKKGLLKSASTHPEVRTTMRMTSLITCGRRGRKEGENLRTPPLERYQNIQ
jgi:hypothetical protein